MKSIKKIAMIAMMMAYGTTCMGGLYLVANTDFTIPYVSFKVDVQNTENPTPLFKTNKSSQRWVVDDKFEYTVTSSDDYMEHQFSTPGMHKVKLYYKNDGTSNAVYFHTSSGVKKIIQYPSVNSPSWAKGCPNLVTFIQKQQEKSYSVGNFTDCINLETISVPNATNIGNAAFRDCKSLKNTYFTNVITVQDSAFRRCSSLKEISLPLAKSLGMYVWDGCTSLEHIDLPLVEEMAVPASDVGIFENCTNLTSISMPRLNRLTKRAFLNCSNLVEISLSSVTNIDGSAISGCTSLKTINAPNLEYVQDFALSSCPSIESIELPSLKYAGNRSFSNSGFRSISIPNATNIVTLAFYNSPVTNLVVSSLTKEYVKNINKDGSGWRIPKGCTVTCQDGKIKNPNAQYVWIDVEE